MRIDYLISLWNFYHYANPPKLEQVIESVRGCGYGIELWGDWADEGGLYDEAVRGRLAGLVAGMPVALHTAGASTAETMDRHIDCAGDIGARIVVLHPGDLAAEVVERPEDLRPNVEFARRAVDRASERGVTLALENGPLAFLVDTLDAVEDLGFCLDVGHPYFEDESISTFLAALKDRLVHLHLQDTLSPAEDGDLPGAFGDHYILGTGGIPADHWQCLARTLKEIDFCGLATFEIHPRNPFQTACLGKAFMRDLLGR